MATKKTAPATSTPKPASKSKSTTLSAAKSAAKTTAKTIAKTAAKSAASEPVILSGGNPQIAKGDGDAPVQAYLAAIPDWKRDVATRLDALITRTVPDVRKAVRWNSPFYGVEGQGWFLGYHCVTKYLKVTFFRGGALTPPPPESSKQPEVRYLHLTEQGPFDEEQIADWIRQASRLPGWDGR